MKNARERMDVLAAYREVGTYRGAAAICGTTHKTVRRIVERHDAGGVGRERAERVRNYDGGFDWWSQRCWWLRVSWRRGGA